MKHPNRIQSVVLLDEPFDGLDDIARNFARVIEMKTGAAFVVPDHRPGMFSRLFGGGQADGSGELMLTFEYLNGPGALDVYEGALGSAITGILCPTMRQRVARAHSRILLEVSPGVLGTLAEDPKFTATLSDQGVD